MKFFFVLKDTWLLKAPFELINDFQCKLVVDQFVLFYCSCLWNDVKPLQAGPAHCATSLEDVSYTCEDCAVDKTVQLCTECFEVFFFYFEMAVI